MDHQLSAILDEVTPRVGEWYPDRIAGAPAQVSIEADDRRSINRVIRLLVSAGDSPVARLIIKTENLESPVATTSDDRPRLFPITEPGRRVALEFAALRLLEQRLTQVGDERLRPIRALAVLEGSMALVMEAYAGRPLHRLLLRGTLRQARTTARPSALANAAGAWLRVLHETPAGDDVPVRQGSPAELADAFGRFGEYLTAARPSRDLSRTIAIGKEAAAAIVELPVGIGHGDFAPRNILVDSRARIAVIDLLARWQAPCYEDVAAFLLAMRTSRANASTRGMLFGRAIDRLEPAFLEGYFGERPVPTRELRVYELLLLLDKWSARLARQKNGGAGLQERLIDRYFESRSRHLARLLAAGG